MRTSLRINDKGQTGQHAAAMCVAAPVARLSAHDQQTVPAVNNSSDLLSTRIHKFDIYPRAQKLYSVITNRGIDNISSYYIIIK